MLFSLATESMPIMFHSDITLSVSLSTLWAIWKLRRAGFTCEELIKFYKATIRPVAEYIFKKYRVQITTKTHHSIILNVF